MNTLDTVKEEHKDEVLLRQDFEPYLSEYLEGGYKDDTMTLKKVTITEDMICGEYDMTSYNMPGDGNFHFTAVLATIAISQLGIIYCCKDNQIPKKSGEVYIRDIAWKFRKVYTITKGITVAMQLLKRREINGGNEVFYKGRLIVGDNHFVGTGMLAFSKNHLHVVEDDV